MPPNQQQPPVPQPLPANPGIQGYPAQQVQMNPQFQQPAQQMPMQVQQPAQAIEQQQNTPEKSNQKAKNNQSMTTTQHSLLFSEIRESMVIMGDGTFRAIVACKPINFDLMSGREREGIEYSYQNFLNSLSFDIQIFVRSRRVDIAPYLDKLDDLRRSQDNMLLGVLMDDYIAFIEQLAEESNIMDKGFYIVIPFAPLPDASKLVEKGVEKGKGFFSRFFVQQPVTVTKIDQPTYQKAKDEIQNRVQSVLSGLYQMGVSCRQLDTKELGELYYNIYNPDTAVNQPLGDFGDATSVYVKKAAQPAGGQQ